jgi:hypothetical protein
MRVATKGAAIVLVLGITMGSNLGLDLVGTRAMSAQEMDLRTGGNTGDKLCALDAGITLGCLYMGNLACALGGALVWMVACETGG